MRHWHPFIEETVQTIKDDRHKGDPYLDQFVLLANSGTKNVLVVPIGFVAEHVEILYDLDIVAQEQACLLGLRLKRTRMQNDRQEMVAILQSIVEESGSRFSESMVIEETERCFA